MRSHGDSMVCWGSLILMLSCAVSSATRYSEYSDIRMPQYGAQAEDSDAAPAQDEYHDRSPDAPARLDYKYEEEPQEKSDEALVKDLDDERIWDKPLKKKRIPLISDIDRNIDLDKYTTEEMPTKLRSNRRFVKHRSRIQKDDADKIIDRPIYSKSRSIGQNDELDEIENKMDYADKEDSYRPDSFDAFEEKSKYSHRPSTKRKAGRKPRHRAINQPARRSEFPNLKSDEDEMDTDRRTGRNYMGERGMRRFNEPPRPPSRNSLIDANPDKKNYDDYGEYYDMKRVNSMKHRLPALFRQTQVTSVKTPDTPLFEDWSFRRADSSEQHSQSVFDSTTAAPLITSTTMKSTSTTPTTSTASQPTQATSPQRNTSELSLAEKSRLSILKKAQRKESSRNASSTTKPPVLMQVTRRMQTMVMVEPVQEEGAVARAREFAEETPERVDRAKRLMRHKLVARARSIHDLTDNWDEMVCDYIDVDLLENLAASQQLHQLIPLFSSLLCFFIYF